MSDAAPGVAVFGGSEPRPGDALYEQARRLGGLLASAGFPVVNGGYGGVMEAASRGAREKGGHAIGVTVDLFSARGGGNPFLTEVVPEPDLFVRTRTLVARSAAFVVLAGKSGTLAELAFLWALERAGLLEGRPIVLLGGAWRGPYESLRGAGVLEPSQESATHFAADPDEAVAIIQAALRPGVGSLTGDPAS